MTTNIRPLLVELLTEELPPKALQKLGQAFAEGVRATLAPAWASSAAEARPSRMDLSFMQFPLYEMDAAMRRFSPGVLAGTAVPPPPPTRRIPA